MEACCTALIGEANTHHAACIKEVEADCASILAEAENCCMTAIREAESQGASQAHLIWQLHAKDMQHLEAEAIDEEGMEHLTFLATCGSALRACSPEAHRILVTPFGLLLGNAQTSALLSIPPGLSPFQLEPTLGTPPASISKALEQLPWPKQQHHSPNQVEPSSPSESTSKAALDEPPIRSRRRSHPS